MEGKFGNFHFNFSHHGGMDPFLAVLCGSNSNWAYCHSGDKNSQMYEPTQSIMGQLEFLEMLLNFKKILLAVNSKTK